MAKKTPKPTVFVSYCHNDINQGNLDYLVLKLKEVCVGKVDILVDNKNMKVGDNINSYMNRVNNCVCAMVILTPSYKVKVLAGKDGVNTEFNMICDRLKKQQEIDVSMEDDVETSPISRFEVIPILFSGDVNTSMPKELEGLLYEDFRELRVGFRNGIISIPKEIELKFQKKIRNISEKIVSVAVLSLRDFKDNYNDYFKLLFKESKSEWSNPEYTSYIDTLFVKTDVFKKVLKQDAWFIIGRKGSGKSTITDILPKFEPDKYLTTIPIYADNISLITTYNIFTSNQAFFSDSKNVYQRLRLFQFGWELFLFISCIYKLVEMSEKQKLIIPARQMKKLKEFIHNILQRRLLSEDTDFNVIFTHSFSKLQVFIETTIKNARSDTFGADLTSPLAIEVYREFLIPKNVLNSFYGILSGLKQKILLSFDGVDTIFDLFRKDSIRANSDDLIERANFEVDWLNSLLLLVLNQGINHADESQLLYKALNYCITIPKDRFLEVRKVDRDTFRHHGRFAPLNWSGVELAEFLRKRLEHLENAKSDKLLAPEGRLEAILARHYSHIPREIEFEFNGRQYRMPLFFYILRHTFWRPRDVLFYYANILTLAKELKFKKSEITSEKIRYIIRVTTSKVIKSEFINEFSTSYDNIEDVIGKFKRRNQILDYTELTSILSQIDLRVSTGSLDEVTSRTKIEFLYQIGFLGIVVSERVTNRFYTVNKHAFIFNESFFVFEQHSLEDLQESLFLIHPIFCEYLQLETKKNEELVLQFDWEYLHTKEYLRNVMQDF